MNKFPYITNIDQFTELLKSKPEIQLKAEIVDDLAVGIIHYMIAKDTTFDSELACECRGITFRLDTGEILSRPFHKFFNVNEKEFTQEDKIDWATITHINDKIDGSLAIPVLLPSGYIHWKTKKSFYSDVALDIQKYYEETKTREFEKFLIEHLSDNQTLMYEWCNPDKTIVIQHKEKGLHFLSLRDNFTGEYLRFSEDALATNKFKSCREFKQYVDTLENIEGYVIANSFNFYKVKTKWYFDRHKAISKLSVRSIIDMYCNDTLDDVIAEMYSFTFDKIAKLLETYQNEFTNYILVDLSMSKNLLAILQNNIQDELELKKEIAKNKEYSAVMFALLKNQDYNTVLRKRMKNFFYEKYKGITHFMGD